MRIHRIVIVLMVLLALTSLTAAQGGVLSYGDTVTSEISAAAPLSFFTFSGTENDLVSIYVLSLNPGFQPTITLVTATGEQMGSSTGDPLTPIPNDASINRRLPQSGVYTILVNSADGTPGNFALSLYGEAGTSSETLSEGPSTSAVTTVQVYNFSVEETSRLRVSGNPADFLFTAVARDADGNVISVVSTGVNQLAFTFPAGGPYEVTFTPFDPAITGELNLVLDAVAGRPSITDDTAEAPPPVATEEASPDTDEVPPPVTTEEASAVPCRVIPNNPTGAFLYDGPGTEFTVVDGLPGGTVMIVTGRDGDWLYGEYNGSSVWVPVQSVVIEGDCDGLPLPDSTSATEDAPPPVTTEEAGVTDEPPTPVVTEDAPPPVATEETVITDEPPTPVVTEDAPPPVTTEEAVVTEDSPPPPVTTEETAPAQQVVTATRTPTATQQTATATYTPSYTPSVTYTPSYTPTATYTPSYTPTATYTPSYTPTTPPAAQVAPEDARFNNPLTIPLDNTTSVLDFVSYPGGDREDRVRWDITGMNQNASLTGGRARLVIAVSCFGQNTDQIQFFTGGQTYSCGQTLVDQEVTFNSKTGSVIITAVGGEGTYVQWVLTGTATRVN